MGLSKQRGSVLIQTQVCQERVASWASDQSQGERRQWSNNWATGSGLTCSGCQSVLQGNTQDAPHTIPLRVLYSVHCACSTNTTWNTIDVAKDQLQQSPLCMRIISLLARVMPMPARALRARMPDTCLHVPCPCLRVRSRLRVFAILVFLAHCWRWYSAAERHSTGESISASAHAPARTPGTVSDSSVSILQVIRPQTLRLSVSCTPCWRPWW